LSSFIETYNCRLGSVNQHKYPVSRGVDLEKCLASAELAHQSGALIDISTRVEFLSEIQAQIIHHKEALFELYSSESSLGRQRFDTEFDRTLKQLNCYRDAAVALSIQKNQSILPDSSISKKPLPLGPIAVFGASNFPLAYATLGGDVMGAFAAGCPVIVKGHPLHAGTSLLSASLIINAREKLNLHPGVFGHVLDAGFDIGQTLVQDPRIKGCGFTGSFSGGMAIYRLTQNRKDPIPCFAEMGSLNPVIILPNAKELSIHLNSLVQSVTTDAGQFCTKPGVIFCPNSMLPEALKTLNYAFEIAAPHPMLHPSIQKRYQNSLEVITQHFDGVAYLKTEIEFGITRGFFKVTTEQFLKTPSLQQELFGPAAVIATYDTPDELLRGLAPLKGQLTMTLIGENPNTSEFFEWACMNAGRVILNGVPTGVSVVADMHHGGPFPASTDDRFSAVGEASILRFIRYVAVQNSVST
jgi:alpha-ketoglutaric semialdehyde dehydrogenase